MITKKMSCLMSTPYKERSTGCYFGCDESLKDCMNRGEDESVVIIPPRSFDKDDLNAALLAQSQGGEGSLAEVRRRVRNSRGVNDSTQVVTLVSLLVGPLSVAVAVTVSWNSLSACGGGVIVMSASVQLLTSTELTVAVPTKLFTPSLSAAPSTIPPTTTVNVSLAPTARSPTVHVGSLKLPAPLGVIESTVTPAGNVSDSVTVMPEATEGPLLVTVTV